MQAKAIYRQLAMLCLLVVFFSCSFYVFQGVLQEWTQSNVLCDELSARIKVGHSTLGVKVVNRTIHQCINRPAMARARYAVVSLITKDKYPLVESAVKLARSVRWWLDEDQMDLVMLLMEPASSTSSLSLQRGGWTICEVPVIECGPACSTDDSHFVIAKLYTKLHVWAMAEYEAVLYLDTDTLVIRDPSNVFMYYLPSMMQHGYDLAAARDRPFFMPGFNAGVMLVRPTLHKFSVLVESIVTVTHTCGYAEQSLLNAVYGTKYSELPFVYNANLVSVQREPGLWNDNWNRIVILHFTVSKGWNNLHRLWIMHRSSFDCWWWGTTEICDLWENA